jgi:hypothetical protein
VQVDLCPDEEFVGAEVLCPQVDEPLYERRSFDR